MKKLVRLRVLKEHFVLDGINLPKGDYDGQMSWNEQPVMGFSNRAMGPSSIFVTCAFLRATEQSTSKDNLSIEFDTSTAIKRGEIVVL